MIMSSDAVGSALLGALIETLGYLVAFAVAPERLSDAVRRERPALVLLDGSDPAAASHENIGHALMRGVPLIVFGPTEALRRATAEQRVVALELPASIEQVEAALQKSLTDS